MGKKLNMERRLMMRVSDDLAHAIMAAHRRDQERHPGLSLATTIRTLVMLGLAAHANSGKREARP